MLRFYDSPFVVILIGDLSFEFTVFIYSRFGKFLVFVILIRNFFEGLSIGVKKDYSNGEPFVVEGYLSSSSSITLVGRMGNSSTFFSLSL